MKLQELLTSGQWATIKAGTMQPAPAVIITAIEKRHTSFQPEPEPAVDKKALHLNKPFFCTCCEDWVDAVTTSYFYKGAERVSPGAALCRRCLNIAKLHKSLNR